jgi:hypothetical protein
MFHPFDALAGHRASSVRRLKTDTDLGSGFTAHYQPRILPVNPSPFTAIEGLD